MHCIGGIIDCAYLGYSHVLPTYSYETITSLGDQIECCIQASFWVISFAGCIKMVQGNWMEENESVIRRNMFFGINFESDEIKSRKIINELDEENCKGEREELSILIAKQLRYFADQFEIEFQKACITIQSHRDKSSSSHQSKVPILP
ncbi:unnamed protein product [Onchocerca ochengi]|uniref:Uncharacterized protein n=1 Tax=Onchocerca ochengi TaxID=42157 RepID=A0A182E8E4_ONCOC|nr:unnamed protein product [Onchocerca ochengi]